MAADMGISQETLMAHYLSNHVAVAYGDIFDEMVALSQELGFRVRARRSLNRESEERSGRSTGRREGGKVGPEERERLPFAKIATENFAGRRL